MSAHAEAKTGRSVPLDIEALAALAGKELGVTGWREVTQDAVSAFADLTGDHQFIYTDPGRARETVFGGPIAHGFYTVSQAPMLLDELLSLEHFPVTVIDGLDELQFPSPLPIGDSVRMWARLSDVQRSEEGATLLVELTFERATSDKPACVARLRYTVFEAL